MLGNPLTDLPSSLGHSPGGAGWRQRGTLEIGIGVCGQGRQQRGHPCLLHPRGPSVTWHALETIDTAVVVPRSKTDRSLDGHSAEKLAKVMGPVFPSSTLSPLLVFLSSWVPVRAAESPVYGESEPVLRGQQQQMGSSEVPNHLLPGGSVPLGKFSARTIAFGGPPLGSRIIAPVILRKRECGSVRGGWRCVMLGARSH